MNPEQRVRAAVTKPTVERPGQQIDGLAGVIFLTENLSPERTVNPLEPARPALTSKSASIVSSNAENPGFGNLYLKVGAQGFLLPEQVDPNRPVCALNRTQARYLP